MAVRLPGMGRSAPVEPNSQHFVGETWEVCAPATRQAGGGFEWVESYTDNSRFRIMWLQLSISAVVSADIKLQVSHAGTTPAPSRADTPPSTATMAWYGSYISITPSTRRIS